VTQHRDRELWADYFTIAPRVMIDTLVGEGVTWAGWYNPRNLAAKHREVFSAFMSGGYGKRKRLSHRQLAGLDPA
jgi:hypothetical protein